jgi:acetyl esterase/lipase
VNLRRWLIRALLILGGVLLLIALAIGAGWWWLHPSIQRTGPLVYAQRKGKDLTVEFLAPANPNGIGVFVMVSGSWKSRREPTLDLILAPLLRRGYTAIPITHGSQPEFSIMEIVDDIQRGVRFARSRAKEHGLDPDRMGVVGGSSGGHLCLMLATRGRPGPVDAPDPIDRGSSAVQAVACFYPVTDLLNLGKSTENPGDGGPPKSFVRAFGAGSTNREAWKVIGRDLSPLHHVSSNLPPTLIHHGDADTLVPLEQSEWFQARAKEVGRTVEIVVHPGQKHGWATMILDIREFADWFDRYLKPGSSSK